MKKLLLILLTLLLASMLFAGIPEEFTKYAIGKDEIEIPLYDVTVNKKNYEKGSLQVLYSSSKNIPITASFVIEGSSKINVACDTITIEGNAIDVTWKGTTYLLAMIDGPDYQVLSETSSQDLKDEVLYYLSKGYQIGGYSAVESNGIVYYTQVVYKY